MDAFEEFLLTVRRDINCLSDQSDRNVRRLAITRLEKTLLTSGKTKEDYARRLFLGELQKPLLRCFSDQVEKCRETSMSMALRFTEMISPEDLDNVLPLLLSALLGRINRLPFPEGSEELRLEALRFLNHLLKAGKTQLNPFAGEIVEALSAALTDTCPDAKKECCDIIKKVSEYFDAERVSRAGTPLVAALLGNLRHQQWKVRRATLESLGALLSSEECMSDHMEEVLPQLNALLSDRTIGVRQCLSDVLEKWLIKGLGFRQPLISNNLEDDGPCGFDKFEHRLVMLLLSVAADEETEQVAPLALKGLERVAVKKHEALKVIAEKRRVKARKMAEAQAARKERNPTEFADEPNVEKEEDVKDPTAVADFDYAEVRGLLPEPFASGNIPTTMTSTYVVYHLPTVLPQVLVNLTQWTTDIRSAAARLLRVVLVEANRQVAPYLDQILVHMYKASSDDEQAVTQAVLQCAALLGTFLGVDLLLALVGKHLGLRAEQSKTGAGYPAGVGVDDIWEENRRGRQTTRTVLDLDAGVKNFSAASLENRRQVFVVLAHLLPPVPAGSEPRMALAEVRSVLRYLEEGSQSDDLLLAVFASTRSLLAAAAGVCVEEWPRVFDLLLRFRSGETCDSAAVDASMDILAGLCGKSRQRLYEEHLRSRLGEILQGAEAELWDDKSPKRHVLETLLRNAGPATAEHVGVLVPALARQSCPDDASVPARIDILGLVHFLLTCDDEALVEALRLQASPLLELVLIPNCTWRAGQSNNKIRKGGMICVHALLEKHLIEPEALNELFPDLLPMLKSGLDDSFSPDNRLISCLVLKATLSELKAVVNAEQLREIYPELLKRLDDSNDKIRVAICEALAVFFEAMPPRWSRSLFEYILRTLFVHLDDPNPEIQQGVYSALETAVHQDYATFIAEARSATAKSSHPRQCEELMRLAESLQRASVDVDDGDEQGMN